MSININGKLRIKGATTGGSGGGTPNYTFKTTAEVGGTNSAYIETSTGYVKFNATVYPAGEINYTLDDPNGEYTLVACDAGGNPSGDITRIDLPENQITSFNGTGLSALIELNLTSNQLTSFNGTGLSSLTNLDLTTNQLTSFNGTGLSALDALDLRSNLLTPSNLHSLPTSLTRLYFYGGNQITSYDFSQLINLNELSLGNNGLTSLSGFTFPSSLTSLGLDNNQLTSFNGTGLSSLTYLSLEGNQLTSFNGTGLSSLTNLELYYNPLVSFDGGDMSLITSLDFTDSDNDGAGAITTLETFNGGNMTSLGTDPDKSGALALRLNGNPLVSFNGGNMTGLTQLNFPSWGITTLESFDGGTMTGLTNLNLSGNQLISFNGTGLSSLTILDLNGNGLTSLSGFTFPSSLTELYLNNNQLTSFNGTGLTSLTTLSLVNNPLVSFIGGDMSLITSLDLSGVEGAGITTLESIDVSNLTSLNQLLTYGTLLDASDNDSILAQLDANGVENGSFFGTYNPEDESQSLLRTSASDADYNSLISKGWLINQSA